MRKKRINTPALMLTVREEIQYLKKARIKADDCMIKPFRFEELLVKISRLIAFESRQELRFFEADAGRRERLDKILSWRATRLSQTPVFRP